MSEITLEGVAKVIKSELEPINDRLSALEESSLNHTKALDSIGKDVKALLAAKVVSEYRLERIEHWAKKAGEKIGVELEF